MKALSARPLEIHTTELTITVIGTSFTVERTQAPSTRVQVREGVVEIRDPQGGVRRLSAHDAYSAGPPQEAPPPREETSLSPRLPEPALLPPAPPRPFDAVAIRRQIVSGNVGEARDHIARARSRFASSSGILAELGILQAEADLAERKLSRAVEGYLAVVRDFPTTREAEQALYAAAQLALSEPDAGYDPGLLLRDYLSSYPNGEFVPEAKRLLERSLGKSP